MFNPETGAVIESPIYGEPLGRRRAVPQRLGSRKQELARQGAANTAASVKKTVGSRSTAGRTKSTSGSRTSPNRISSCSRAPVARRSERVQSADIDESNDTIFTVEDGKEDSGSGAGPPGQPPRPADPHLRRRDDPPGDRHRGQQQQPQGLRDQRHARHRISTSSSATRPRSPSPTPNTLPAAHPSGTTATLRAEVDPAGGGTTTDCRFDWGPKTKYEFGTLPCKVGGSETNTISSPTEVTNGVSSLTLGNQYHYRVVDQERERPLVLRRRPALRGVDAADLHAAAGRKDQHGLPGHFHLARSIHTAARPSGASKSAQEDCSLGGCEVIESGEGKIEDAGLTHHRSPGHRAAPRTEHPLPRAPRRRKRRRQDRTCRWNSGPTRRRRPRHLWEPGGAPADLGIAAARLPRLRARQRRECRRLRRRVRPRAAADAVHGLPERARSCALRPPLRLDPEHRRRARRTTASIPTSPKGARTAG